MAAALWEATLPVGKRLAQAIGVKATTPSPSLQLLIIPGNPGLCYFYKVFIQELHSLFKGSADVWAVSNLGHDASNLSQGAVWCLNSHIQHTAQLLRQHVMAPGKPPAVLLCHSIGSYITLQALKQLEEERAAQGQQPADTSQWIHKVILLMPFLATDWSSRRQRLLRLAAACSTPIGAAVGLIARLPEPLLRALVHLAEPTAEQHTRDSIRALLNANGVRNNFHLAMHEFRDLDRHRPDWELIRQLGPRAVLVCAPDDMWFPMHHYLDAQAAVPGLEEYYNSELTHAFCCHTHQCRLVAQLVRLSVQKALQPSQLTAADTQLQVSNAADASLLLQEAGAQAEAGVADASIVLEEAESGAKAGADAGAVGQASVVQQRQASREPAGVTA